MAITTYSELQTAIGNWLERSDLSSRIPEFIAMAEARMNRDKRLRTIDSIYRDTLSVSSQFTSLPTDFARMVNVEVDTTPVIALEYLTPQQMDAVRATGATGDPYYYTIIGNELEVVPVQSSAVTLNVIYNRLIAALSDSNTTNWLLTAAPDVYLYACLVESAPFLMNDERLGMWEGLYNSRVDAYAASSDDDSVGGSPLIVRSFSIG